MVCPKCGIVCRVGKTYHKSGDGLKWICHDMVCRNRQCSEYDTVVETVENVAQVNSSDDEASAE